MPTEAEHLALMHPFLRERATRALSIWRGSARPGEVVKVVESVRPLATQQAYFAAGKSKADGIVKLSLHQFAPALAFDVAVIVGGKYVASAAASEWQRWGAAVEIVGLEWGGRWRGLVDAPHAQITSTDRVKLLQAAAGVAADGDWGPATTRAVGVAGWPAVTTELWSRLAATR